MANIQAVGMGLQIQRAAAEIANIKADTKQKEVQSVNTASQTETIEGQRNYLIEKLRQEGIEKWMNNEMTKFKQTNTEDGVVRNPILDWFTSVNKESTEVRLLEKSLLKTAAETGNQEAQMILNNERARTLVFDLMTARINANANAENAVTNKLMQEFNTGYLS